MGASRHGGAPRRLGNYEVLGKLGNGGMGVVFLARQPSLERFVVLKKIRRELVADEGMVDRFQLEARAAAAIQHQNVVAVHDCFTYRGDQYIAQELVDGKDLQTILGVLGRIDPSVAAIVALELARGLEEIHAKGIVHRDLKPANILIGRGGEIKIADFGIALGRGPAGLTRPGTMLGSVPYMSPEQMQGQAVDPRSDLYSFGVLLYELLTGVPPFAEPADDDFDGLIAAMRKGRWLPARRHRVAVPRYLERLIRGCLQYKSSRRIPSATRVRQLLERRVGRISPSECRRAIAGYLVDKKVLKSPSEPTSKRPARRRAKRPRRAMRFAVVSAIVGLMLVGAVAAVRLSSDETGVQATPETLPAPLPSVAAEPARVRFAADPWARVQLADGTSFLTPRAAPVALDAGSHRVVFEHPSFGRVEYTIDVAPGERRSLRHTYDEVTRE